MKKFEIFKDLFKKYITREISTADFKLMRKASMECDEQQVEKVIESAWYSYNTKVNVQNRLRVTMPVMITENSRHQALNRWRNAFVAMAAMVAIVLTMQYMWYNNKLNHGELVSIETLVAQRSKLNMPDGTIVELNNQSLISYTSNYGRKTREMSLNGEAIFDVAKNKDTEFVVTTDNIKVVVTGTRFNILDRKGDDESTITLLEGSVAVSSTKYPSHEITLKPNQKATINNNSGEIKVSRSNTAFDTAWTKGELAFSQEHFMHVINQIERSTGVDFIVKGSVSNELFSGRFLDSNVDDILKILKLHYHFEYTRDKDVIILEFNQ